MRMYSIIFLLFLFSCSGDSPSVSDLTKKTKDNEAPEEEVVETIVVSTMRSDVLLSDIYSGSIASTNNTPSAPGVLTHNTATIDTLSFAESLLSDQTITEQSEGVLLNSTPDASGDYSFISEFSLTQSDIENDVVELEGQRSIEKGGVIYPVKEYRTSMVTGFSAFGNSDVYTSAVVHNGYLYFKQGETPLGSNGNLYRTDGVTMEPISTSFTTAETDDVYDNLLAFDSEIYYPSYVSGEIKLYKYNPATGVSTKVADVLPSGTNEARVRPVVVHGNVMYFVSNTAEGTSQADAQEKVFMLNDAGDLAQLTDIVSSGSDLPFEDLIGIGDGKTIVEFDGSLFFVANDGDITLYSFNKSTSSPSITAPNLEEVVGGITTTSTVFKAAGDYLFVGDKVVSSTGQVSAPWSGNLHDVFFKDGVYYGVYEDSVDGTSDLVEINMDTDEISQLIQSENDPSSSLNDTSIIHFDYNNSIYLSIEGLGLARYDMTTGEVVELADSVSPKKLETFVFEGELFFLAENASENLKLFAATPNDDVYQVTDINRGFDDFKSTRRGRFFKELNGAIYFPAEMGGASLGNKMFKLEVLNP